ncbi:MAG: helix-turn-helix domain-containing protein [Burkholderiaceae bacterium]|nr:MAG: helix-turn-helix domain-containing protein [Burkholderiaceae bacterium]TBR76661.1 MAG: helix-turn-helix domain-containing protein [Burkholderiaceae bacterium]
MLRLLTMDSFVSIGNSVRSLRKAKSLSQGQLASDANVSRTTLVQIEQGKSAQLSSLGSVLRVVGGHLNISNDSPEVSKRRQARAANELKLAASREKHLKIALKFALGDADSVALKEDALRLVDMWQQQELCSLVYIEKWRQILNAEPSQIARNLASSMDDEWGPALRQNTPFAMSAA